MNLEVSIINALKLVGMPVDITTMLADRDCVEPKAPYMMIQIIDVHNIGLPRKIVYHENGDVKESLFQTKEYNIALTFHASTKGSTLDWVDNFHTGLMSDMVDWAFSQQGLGLVRDNGIMYQSQPVNGKNYKRAIIDITLRAEVHGKFDVNPLSKVTITGYLNGVPIVVTKP